MDTVMYYCDDNKKEFYEIHSEPVLNRRTNESIDIQDVACYFDYLKGQMSAEVGCDIFLLGRSGRHVCIEDGDKLEIAKDLRKNKYRKLAYDFIL